MTAADLGQALPPDGVDLRAELAAHQRRRLEQALAMAQGDAFLAAKLLRVSPLDIARMRSGTSVVAWQRSRPARANQATDDLPRIEGGREVMSRAGIKRLAGEGYNARQIADRFGVVNEYAIEKILRAEAELAKCGDRS
jgi:hypothetical protein